ncbi:hypothetical protein EC991_010210 [Linnemannia zychae]|nr:hypothetical protein EC991_010210 [Linnemannia zychae]
MTFFRVIIFVLETASIFAMTGWFARKKLTLHETHTTEDKFKIATICILWPCGLLLIALSNHWNGRIYIVGPFVLSSLVLFIKHLARGGYYGFGDACTTHQDLCNMDHANTFLALTVAALMVVELIISFFGPDEFGDPRRLQWRRAQVATPLPKPTPQQQPLTQQLVQQQKGPQRQDEQLSSLSTAAAFKDEQGQTKKGDKRHLTITVDTLGDFDLGLHSEQFNVPNPVSFNPGSKPNQGL